MTLYNILLNILFIPLFFILLIISLFNIRLRTTFLSRIGFSKIIKFKQRPVWFHCSSLGEFSAIKNVIINLKKQYNEIFITTLTDTGFKAAREFLGTENVSILPLDFNFLIKKFIKKLNPLVLIIEETEIWPNLIYQNFKLKIPIIYTNCIISEKSYKFYNFLHFIFKKILNKINIFFIQNKDTGKYLIDFGIDKAKIKYIGNIKFDIKISSNKNARKIKKRLYIDNRFIITAGSTRKGEENILMNIINNLKIDYKELFFILAPRHLDRINEIINLAKKFELKYSLYSNPEPGCNILIVDKMGVLLDMYLISNISFIGGTLVPVGGHNPLEAVSFKKPILCGKYINNNKEAFLKITGNNGGFIVDGEKELQNKLKLLLNNRKKLLAMGNNAYKILKDNQGASQKIVKYLIDNYVGDREHK